MSDLDDGELIATRKLHGQDDGLYRETSDKNVAIEEDIKVIKNIERLRHIEFKHCVTDREIKAMQNILAELERKDKRIQELEEECKRKDMFLQMSQEVIENSILTQRVENKIEENKQILNKTNDVNLRERLYIENGIMKEILEGDK